MAEITRVAHTAFIYWAIALMTLLTLDGFGTTAYAQAQSGDVRIEIVSGGFIVGASGGNGTLVYNGKRYRLGVGGISLGATIGLAKASFYGRAYNLRRPSDISGTYYAADVGYALVGGRKVARLKNARGVVLEVRGRQIGLEATVDVSGMQIWLR